MVDSLSDKEKEENFVLISIDHQITTYLRWNHRCHTESWEGPEGFLERV